MKRGGSLFRKYAVYFVALVSAALIASGCVGLYFTYQESKTALLALQREKAGAAASRIEAYVQEIEHQLGWMKLPQIGASNLEQRRVEYLKLLRQVPAITEVSMLDRTGKELLRVSRLGMDVVDSRSDVSGDPKFTVARQGKTYLSPVYFRKETEPYMTIAVAGLTEETGITVAEVNLKFIWDVISRIKIGQKGLAYVVDSRGQLIAHPDISLVLQKTDLSGLAQVKAAREAQPGADDIEQVALARDMRGGEVLTAYSSIGPLGWHVFVEQPMAEAFAPLYASLQRTAWLVFAGLVLAVFASLYFARRMVRPIEAIRAGAGEIAKGQLDQRIEVRTGDELEALAGEFNNMAKQLRDSYADLERKVDERTKDLAETLEQQTATAEILRVISSSPTDLHPVFDAITQSAMRLFDGTNAFIGLVQGDRIEFAAGGARDLEADKVRAVFPIPLSRDYFSGRAVLDKKVLQFTGMDDPDLPAQTQHTSHVSGANSGLFAPLLREDTAIGVLNLIRSKPGSFSAKQVSLLQTFADQAVIAIENVRLFKELEARNRDLDESLEYQTATAGVLRIVSASVSDAKPVFDTILSSVLSLFEGFDASIWLLEDDRVVPVVADGPTMSVRPDARPSVPLNSDFIPSQVIAKGKTLYVLDAQTDPALSEEQRRSYATSQRRTIVGVPLVHDGKAFGSMSISKVVSTPVSEKQLALLATFADQAVIAIQNAHLFKELEARNKDLAESLEQQTATAEILRVISSSPTDMQPVFEAIAESAQRLLGSEDGAVWLVRGDRVEPVVGRRARSGLGGFPLDRSHPIGRAVLDGEPVRIPDTETPVEIPGLPLEFLRRSGQRALLAVPMIRGGGAVGIVTATWSKPTVIDDKHVALLKTFADQAVIAIENVRLFKELEVRNRDLSETLEQQEATGEVLRIISRSLNDTKPVFDAIHASILRLFRGFDASVWLVEKDHLVPVVVGGPTAPKTLPPQPLSREFGGSRVVLDRKVAKVDDVETDPDLTEAARRFLLSTGRRSALRAPLLRDGEGIGLIAVSRTEPTTFTAKQISLIQTFADQAVIAIENVRLFNEIQDKGRQLEIANRHKSEFLANMSHELRTPLNAVIGFSEVLQQKMFGELNDKQHEYINDIHESGRHLLSLINDILDLSKIEAGRMELELSSFDVPAAIENALTLVRERALRREVTLASELDDRLDQITADERKFKQILLNLLSNAVKFTPAGGRVDVLARQCDGVVEVAVRDTGIGIAPEDQEAVFEEFRQVGKDYTNKAEGTGLGLALTRKFVELHGGTIRLESVPGQGSTFTFALPINKAAEHA